MKETYKILEKAEQITVEYGELPFYALPDEIQNEIIERAKKELGHKSHEPLFTGKGMEWV